MMKNLPAGVINFITGSGRATCSPIMKTGKVDVLGFIGGHKAADALVQAHPAVHRLKVFSQLEGKNLGIVLADADLDQAAEQCALGGLSYNGQRCTAIKMVLVHESVAAQFVEKLKAQVAKKGVGLPWDSGVLITPLPEPNKTKYLTELVDDAVQKGAEVVYGGQVAKTIMHPAVVYPVTPEMRLFTEEQFGPVVPVGSFSSMDQVFAAVRESWNGQQAAVFTRDGCGAAPLVNMLATTVCRININAQCGRSPDVLPFAGRRSSAMGTMSITGAIREFSVETVLCYPTKCEESKKTALQVAKQAKFFEKSDATSTRQAMRGA
jgi:glyceraldehyde-3-phosphate dehydrogenase (NADP+)